MRRQRHGGVIFWRCRLGDTRQGGFRAKRETTPPALRCDRGAAPALEPLATTGVADETVVVNLRYRKEGSREWYHYAAGSPIRNSTDESGLSPTARRRPGQLDTAEDRRIVPRRRPLLEGLAGDRHDGPDAIGVQLRADRLVRIRHGFPFSSHSRAYASRVSFGTRATLENLRSAQNLRIRSCSHRLPIVHDNGGIARI